MFRLGAGRGLWPSASASGNLNRRPGTQAGSLDTKGPGQPASEQRSPQIGRESESAPSRRSVHLARELAVAQSGALRGFVLWPAHRDWHGRATSVCHRRVRRPPNLETMPLQPPNVSSIIEACCASPRQLDHLPLA
jgi:hypothetical protein